jgi:hypothetical protein
MSLSWFLILATGVGVFVFALYLLSKGEQK